MQIQNSSNVKKVKYSKCTQVKQSMYIKNDHQLPSSGFCWFSYLMLSYVSLNNEISLGFECLGTESIIASELSVKCYWFSFCSGLFKHVLMSVPGVRCIICICMLSHGFSSEGLQHDFFVICLYCFAHFIE